MKARIRGAELKKWEIAAKEDVDRPFAVEV